MSPLALARKLKCPRTGTDREIAIPALVVTTTPWYRGVQRCRMNRQAKLLLAAIVLTCLVPPSTLQAQTDLSWLLDPRMGQAKQPKMRYAVAGYPARRVKGQRAKFEYGSHDFSLTVPLRQADEYEWSLLTKIGALDINTSGRLPVSGDRFPQNLWDIAVGVAHRRRLDNDWMLGISSMIGSASDEPFAGAGQTTSTTTGFVRIPADGMDAWFVMLRFQTELDALRGAPLLPGVAYHWVKDEQFQAFIGMPYTWVQYRPVKPLKLSALAGIDKAQGKCSYSPVEEVELYARYDLDTRRFVRHDRRFSNERLFFRGQSVSTGVRLDLGEGIWYDLSGGYAFDRFFFEGKRYNNRHGRRFRIGNGPFVAFQIGWNF